MSDKIEFTEEQLAHICCLSCGDYKKCTIPIFNCGAVKRTIEAYKAEGIIKQNPVEKAEKNCRIEAHYKEMFEVLNEILKGNSEFHNRANAIIIIEKINGETK